MSQGSHRFWIEGTFFMWILTTSLNIVLSDQLPQTSEDFSESKVQVPAEIVHTGITALGHLASDSLYPHKRAWQRFDKSSLHLTAQISIL